MKKITDTETALTGTQFIAAIFHSVLFAYQKTVRNTLGRSDIEILKIIEETSKVLNDTSIIRPTNNFEEAVEDLSKFVNHAGLAKLRLEKKGRGEYLLHVDDCVLAREAHKKLDPHDVTCPYALVTMALLQNLGREKVFVANSEYYATGSRTTVRLE